MTNAAIGLLDRRSHRIGYIPQNEASECGLACLAMIANYHGHNIDLSALRRRYPISLKGATVKQLIDASASVGLTMRPIKLDLRDLKHIHFPAILHWDLTHFVVVSKIGRRRGKLVYTILDPAIGRLSLGEAQFSEHFTGVALELRKSASFSPIVERSNLKIHQLWSSIDGLWSTLRSVLLLSMAIQFVSLASPFFLQISVDTVAPSSDKDLLLILAIGFTGVALIGVFSAWLRATTLVSLNNVISFQIITNLFSHLLRLPLDWFERRHIGDIISRFGSTQPITQLLTQGMVASFIDGVMAVLTLVVMFFYSPLLASLAFFALFMSLLLRVVLFHSIRLKNLDVVSTAAKENSTFIESIRGISAIKCFGQEANRVAIWQKRKADAANANIKLGRLSAAFDGGSQLILTIDRILFVYLAVLCVMNGTMSIGMLFAFQSYKQQFLDAGSRLIEQGLNFAVLKVHLARLSDIALSDIEDAGLRSRIETKSFEGRIQVRDVRFRYGSGEAEVLRGASFDVNAGEMVALIGPSGGGKTTLMKIMMSVLEPTGGTVLIDGNPLSKISKADYRRTIGVVAQDDTLYAGSITENISFFDPEPDILRVVEVARIADIATEIDRMPLKYDTLVGDMGSALSGGQRQRVLLARALYHRPKILFMDEGTANLDPDSELKIATALKNLAVTRVMVAHRPALTQVSDKVVLCRNGKAECHVRSQVVVMW